MARMIPDPVGLLQFKRATAANLPLIREPIEAESSLYGRIFDKFVAQPENAAYPLEDDQKRALFRQGLLNFGVAALQPNGGSFGASLASGLSAGVGSMQGGAQNLAELARKNEEWKRGGGMPAGFQEFDLKAKAAGLQPGTQEYQRAAQIALGMEGRAATGGYGFEIIEGPDGRKRYSRRNPRNGAVEVYDESTNSFVPLGGPVFEDGTPVPPPTGVNKDGAPVSFGPGLDARDIRSIQAMEGMAPPPPGFTAQNVPPRPLGVSRSPEETEAAKVAAAEAARLQYAPAFGQVDVETAGGKARETARATAGVEREVAVAKRTRDSGEALGYLDEAEKLLQRATGGRIGAIGDSAASLFNYTTQGAKNAAQLDILAAKLVANVPRFEGPQSNIDVQMYMQAAGDLANRNKTTGERLSALQQMRKIAARYAATSEAPDASDDDLIRKYLGR